MPSSKLKSSQPKKKATKKPAAKIKSGITKPASKSFVKSVIKSDLKSDLKSEPVIKMEVQTEIEPKPEPLQTVSEPENRQKETVSPQLESAGQNTRSGSPSEAENIIKEPEQVTESETETDPLMEKESRLDRINKKLYFMGIVSFILVATVSGLMFYLYRIYIFSNRETVEENVIIPTVTAVPTPPYDKAKVIIEVLNGSGVRGAAGRAQEKLNTAGYPNVTAGNADKNDYKGNTLYVNPEFGFSGQLLSDLKDLFDITSSAGDITDSSVSARIIIGK